MHGQVRDQADAEARSRFAFGDNWQRFLNSVDAERVTEARRSLVELLRRDDLSGLRLLDIGCGSGLFSLAARLLGATVHSFDDDPASVACADALKQRYRPDDPGWHIERGSVLDESYLGHLGPFDVVYAWGVLHHTGEMRRALRNAGVAVAPGGALGVAIYNDQELISRLWLEVKRLYNSGRVLRGVLKAVFVPAFAAQGVAIGVIKHRHPLGHFMSYRARRGMSVYHDWIDWLGGYPFEVAKPEEIVDLYLGMGFTLERLITTNRSGCNQFLFRRPAAD